MTTVSPVLTITGRLYEFKDVDVPARVAAVEVRDPESGRVTTPAVEARAAYQIVEAVILTDGGGFASVSVKRPEWMDLTGGEDVTGRDVAWKVRTWVRWQRGKRGAFAVVGYVFHAVADAMPSQGRRAAAVPA